MRVWALVASAADAGALTATGLKKSTRIPLSSSRRRWQGIRPILRGDLEV